jgi:hypothetical protein
MAEGHHNGQFVLQQDITDLTDANKPRHSTLFFEGPNKAWVSENRGKELFFVTS